RDDSDLKDLVFPCPSPYAFLNSDILNPGEVSLLAIAPLTNIAMAIKKDPSITDKIKHLYIIGGTNNALGNIVPAAEYNFYVDPEAAKLVLQSGIEMTMVGWDMCADYSLMFDEEHAEIESFGTMEIKKDPSITDKIKHLYIIGGTNNALGNIVPAAEYNFYVDPEAAKLVLQSGIEMTMVGWDMCADYSLMFDEEHAEIESFGTM